MVLSPSFVVESSHLTGCKCCGLVVWLQAELVGQWVGLDESAKTQIRSVLLQVLKDKVGFACCLF